MKSQEKCLVKRAYIGYMCMGVEGLNNPIDTGEASENIEMETFQLQFEGECTKFKDLT